MTYYATPDSWAGVVAEVAREPAPQHLTTNTDPASSNINVSPFLTGILAELRALEEAGQLNTTLFVPRPASDTDPPLQ